MRTLAAPSTLSLVSRINVYKIPPSSPIFPFYRSPFSLTPPRPLDHDLCSSSLLLRLSPGDVNKETNLFQLIQAHQEKAARLPPVEEIRTLLSTFSQKHEGYPSGSMVDFACDSNGSPILAVSSLAVHTKVNYAYILDLDSLGFNVKGWLSRKYFQASNSFS